MKRLVLLIVTLLGSIFCYAQNISVGSWEPHFNYKSARQAVDAGKRIFCASYNGLFSYSGTDNTIKSYSKVDGLTESGVAGLAYHRESNTLLAIYRSGNIDLLELNENSDLESVVNIPVLLDAGNLPAVKQINQIVVHEGLGYLATSFGIVVLDFLKREVKENYRYIGNNGSEVNIRSLSFSSDSLYTLTQQGTILATSIKSNVNRQYFANWKTIVSENAPTAIFSKNSALYAGLPGRGIYVRRANKWEPVFETVSQNYSFSSQGDKLVVTLDKQIVAIRDNGQTEVTGNPLIESPKKTILDSAGNLWIADNRQGLIGNREKTFKVYIPFQGDTTIVPRPDSLIKDSGGLVWSILPTYLGGGILVRDQVSGKQRLLTAGTGQGGLPSYDVYSIALDHDGYVWFASGKGVGYFAVGDVLTASRIDATLPVFGLRKLFANEPCYAISVDAGNRKWIGTATGLYLFNSDGSELLRHFTAANSPLPSDTARRIKFEAASGLLFVETPSGMMAYRTDASAPSDQFSNVLIFPNPVRPGYSGVLTINGLTNNSVVKITTLSGRLVSETRSNGGTASWNLRDYTGRRTAPGIYLVMTVSEDKSANFVGKFAVIDGNN